MKKYLVSIILIFTLILNACSVSTEVSREWNLILDSSKGTEVSVVLDFSNEAFVQWFKTDFTDHIKSTYDIDITIEDKAIDKAISQLKAEKQNNIEFGNLDIIISENEKFAELKSAKLLYENFADKLPNISRLDTVHSTLKFKEGLDTKYSQVPISRKILSMVYQEDIFYEKPADFSEYLVVAKSQPDKMIFPNPTTTKEGEALIMGYISSKLDMRDYLVAGRDLSAFRTEVRTALKDFNIYETSKMPSSFETMEERFKSGELLALYSLNPTRIATMIKAYEYPEGTASAVFKSMGTYTSFGVIPFNSRYKSAAMIVLDELISLNSQLNIVQMGEQSVYGLDLADEEITKFKKVKLHKSMIKPLNYIENASFDFDKELRQIVLEEYVNSIE